MCPLQGPITSVVRNKLCCQGRNYRSGTFKTNWKVGLDCYEFLCFESPSVLFASLLPSKKFVPFGTQTSHNLRKFRKKLQLRGGSRGRVQGGAQPPPLR